MHLVNKQPSSAELHKFGWAMLAGFGVIGLLLWYVGSEAGSWGWEGTGKQVTALVLWLLGAALLALSFGPQGLARPIYVGWMTGAMGIGTVVTFLLLSVLFIVLLPVFSLIRFKDPLRMKLLPSDQTYWEDHKHHESTLERTIRPF